MNYHKEKLMKSHLSITSKRIKYLGINLHKETKDLYSPNSKTLIKETEDDTNRCKEILYSWIGRNQHCKMTILPKTTYRFSAIPTKIPTAFFTKPEPKKLKLVWKHKELEYQKKS